MAVCLEERGREREIVFDFDFDIETQSRMKLVLIFMTAVSEPKAWGHCMFDKSSNMRRELEEQEEQDEMTAKFRDASLVLLVPLFSSSRTSFS